jgi:hypothetical protein
MCQVSQPLWEAHPMTLRYDLAAATMLLGCVLAMAAGPGHAAPERAGWRLQDPWPSAGETVGIRSQPVTFPSSSPFTPRDAPRAEPTMATATLYLPPGMGAGTWPRSVPAVVLLHGAGGVLAAREHTYGRQFAAMGAVALVIDVFGARRDRATGFTERLLEIRICTRNNPASCVGLDTKDGISPVSPHRADVLRQHLELG